MASPHAPSRRFRLRWRVPVAAAAIWCALVMSVQRHLLFPGQHMDAPGAAPGVEDAETWWLDVDGAQVEAWYRPAPSASAEHPAALVMVAHGNAELIDHWVPLVGGLGAAGLSVLLVEYPGFGRSEGAPSEDSVTEAMVAAYDLATSRPEVDGARVVGLGRSLGGGAVCALARHRDLAALVLASSFTTVRAFAGRYFMPGLLVRDPFDNEEVLAGYDGPVLVLHGERDDIVPFEHGLRLAEVAADAELVRWDCRHNDCPPRWEDLDAAVLGFLRGRGLLGG